MNPAKIFIILGLISIGVGLLLWLGIPLGRLPGDIHIKGTTYDFYFPIATSFVLSIILAIILLLLRR